jgi:hypothetical protein
MHLQHHQVLLIVAGQKIPQSLGILPKDSSGNGQTDVPYLSTETYPDGNIAPAFVGRDGAEFPARPNRYVILPSPNWIGGQASPNVVDKAGQIAERYLKGDGDLVIVCADTSPATVWLAIGLATAAPEGASGVLVAFDGHAQPANLTEYRGGRPAARGTAGPGIEEG